MGSSSQSATSSTTNNHEVSGTLADYSQGDGPRTNTSVVGDSNTVNVLDGGAIDKAFGFGKDSLDYADKQSERTQKALAASVAATQALAAAQSQNDADTVDKILALTDSITTGGATTVTKWVIGMLIFFAAAGATVLVFYGNKNAKKA